MAEDANSNVDGPVEDVPPGQSGTDAAPPAAGSDQPTAADSHLPEPAAAGPAPEEFTQADIDAALAGAASGEPAPDQPAPTDSPAATSTQAATDAAPAGANAPGSADGQTQPAADQGQFTQADIDAALAAASGGDAGPDPSLEQAEDTRLDSMGRPFDEAAAAIDEEKAAASSTEAAPTGQPLQLPDFTGDGDDSDGLNHEIDLLHNVGLRVKIELGRTRMFVEDVLKLAEGSVVELDKLAGDPVDVFANDRLIARGEVLVLNDNFCVRVSEVISGQVLAP